MSLAGLARTTLREQALKSLRTAILTGEFGPGDHLSEVEVASQLGISRGTVREALRALQQSGLVEAADNGRLRVRELADAQIAELYEIRCLLEQHAAALIMQSSDRDAALKVLRTSLPPAEADHRGPVEQLDLDLRFHETLCRLSGNRVLLDVWRSLQDQVRVVALSRNPKSHHPIMTREFHEPIIESIASGDPDSMRDAIANHMADAVSHWIGQN